MFRTFSLAHLALIPMTLAPIGCSTAQGIEERDMPAPFELRAEEIQAARALAERDLSPAGQTRSPQAKLVFTKIELLPEAQAQTSERRVLVIHYRYPHDETIHTYIDLNRGEVFHRDVLTNFPTPLGKEETTRAVELARTDARLEAILAEHGGAVHLECVPIRASATEDDLIGHRLVHVLLRVGADYLTSPRVVVDLTDEVVLVE